MQKEKLDLFLYVILTSISVLLLLTAGFLLFRIYLKRKNALILEKQKMRIEFEQTLLRSQLEIQEQTFSYISKEIHDNIGQVLSLARLNINTIQAENEREKLEATDELLGKAIADLRNLSHSLDTDTISSNGWIKSTEKILQHLQRPGLTTHFRYEENLPELNHEKSIILFRMIQEMINNIIRHAEATEVGFEVKKDNNSISISLKDNGKGFDKATVNAGNGLRNLESRSKMIGATMNIRSIKNKGTEIIILVNM